MANALFTTQPPFEHQFTNATTVVIDHNLGYTPHVYVIINDYIVFADVEHTTTTRMVVTFLNALTGTVYYS
tara:strand:- start:102 stop:314 length:213 start_codon:yes stop_codon:yes gene_type:complete